MIITIAQYIEALTSPEGRFRTLERLYPAGDESGAPLFSMPGHGLVDFEVMAGGVRHTMRCPLMYGYDAAARLRAIAEKDKGLGGRFFAEWRVLDAEIVLFGEDGGAFEVDILIRPTPVGEPLADFLARAAVSGDIAAAGRVSENFEELVRWAESAGGGGIAMHRVLAGPDGALSVKAFSATDETRRILEILGAGGGTAGRGEDGKEASGYDLDGEGDVRCVRDGGGWMYVDRTGRAVIDAVWTAARPFRGGRAEVETRAGRGLIDIRGREVLSATHEEVVWDDYWGLATVMTEGRWSLSDRDGNMLSKGDYDWLGECFEGLVLAVRDGLCGFLDTAGREAIPCIYDDASSFSEGCALVSLGGENFFIDARGRRIGKQNPVNRPKTA
jgi:hypothetical protein